MSIVIIGGSRSITDYDLLCKTVEKSGFKITEVVEGECPKGVDQLAKRYAREHNIALKPFPAKWDDLSHPNAVIKRNRYGKLYDAAAGHRRNEEMAKYAAACEGKCIVLWDGVSPGSASMKQFAVNYKLPSYFAKVPVKDEPLWENFNG